MRTGGWLYEERENQTAGFAADTRDGTGLDAKYRAGGVETSTATNGYQITSATTQTDLDNWAGENAITIETVNGVTTVKLLKNFDFPNGTMPIRFGNALTQNVNDVMVLDLNGHSISSTTMVVQSECDLTIKDSVGGGKIFMDTSAKPKAAYNVVVNQKKLTIESGIFEAKIYEDKDLETTGVIGSAVAGVETVINGGTFNSNCSAISVTSGTTTVNGGTFTAGTYGVVARNTAVVIFPADTQAAVTSDKFPIVVGTYYGSANAGQAQVAGGDFAGTNAAALVGKIGSVTPTDLVKISGGTFTNSPLAYTGASVVKDSTTYKVGTDATALVQNAKAGDTLTLLRYDSVINVPEGVEIKNETGSSVTVNGNTLESNQQLTSTHDITATAAKEATCTEAGNIAYWYCKICDKYYSDAPCTQEIALQNTVIPAKNHSGAELHNAKEATCTEAGNIAYWYCKICDKYYSDASCTQEIALQNTVIPAKGHGEIELKNAKEATCTAEGYTGDKVCAACGVTIEVGTITAKTAHAYKDGKCDVCGAADPGYKPVVPADTGKAVPKTGDNSPIALYLVLMLTSAVGLTGIAISSRKRKSNP